MAERRDELAKRLNEAKARSARADRVTSPALGMPELQSVSDDIFRLPPRELREQGVSVDQPLTWREKLANLIAGGQSRSSGTLARPLAEALTGTGYGQFSAGSATLPNPKGESSFSPIDVIPGVSEAMSLAEGSEAAQKGDWTGAGIGFAGGILPPGAGKGFKAGREALAEAKSGIRAYHGSPHSFDQFDISKIGTGEGAQAYGHGLYFAENEGIAKSYRDTLAADYFKTNDGKLWSPDALEHLNVRSLLNRTGDIDAALAKANELLPTANAQTLPMLQGDIAKLEDLKARGGVHKGGGGSMYEVNIKADPEHFLDWDKPLSEQPHLLPAMNQAGYSVPKSADLSYLEQKAAESGPDSWYALQLNAMKPQLGKPGAEFAPKTSEATAALQQAGIPGIKYLDAGSRVWDDTAKGMVANYGSREKALEIAQTRLKQSQPRDEAHWQKIVDQLSKDETRNYVVFDPKIIEIVKKYGIAGALGAGLISEEMARQMQQQGGTHGL